MNCKSCIKLYDLSNESLYPQIILPCCHTFCSNCLDQLKEKQCPDCGQVIVDRKANYGLLDLMLDRNSQNQSMSVNLQNLEYFTRLFRLNYDKKTAEIDREFEENQKKINEQTNRLIDDILRIHNSLVEKLKTRRDRAQVELKNILAYKQNIEIKIEELKEKKNEFNVMPIKLEEINDQMNNILSQLNMINFGIIFKAEDSIQLIGSNIGCIVEKIEEVNRIRKPSNETEQIQLVNTKNSNDFSKAKTMLANKEYNCALELFNQCIETSNSSNPNLGQCYLMKGITLNHLKETHHAVECFTKCLELNPDDATCFYHKGATLRKLKEYSESLKCFEMCIELNPTPKDECIFQFARGCTYFDMREFEKAVKCFDRVIFLNPDYKRAIKSKGQCLFELKKFKEALEYLDRTIKFEPRNASLFCLKAKCFQELRDFKQAIEWYDRALFINPDIPDAVKNKKFILNIIHFNDYQLN